MDISIPYHSLLRLGGVPRHVDMKLREMKGDVERTEWRCRQCACAQIIICE